MTPSSRTIKLFSKQDNVSRRDVDRRIHRNSHVRISQGYRVVNTISQIPDRVAPGSQGSSATVQIRATQGHYTVSIVVQDNGLGIPAEERAKVRFYRLDRSRSLPGNGLGLPIVAAISHLHSGTFSLGDAGPGLIACIVLPRVDAKTLPNVKVSATARIGTSERTALARTTLNRL